MPSRSRLDVAPHQRGEDVDDRRLLDRVEPTDGAEVDQSEAAIAEGEDVPGCGIGVEEPDAEHLVEGRAEQLLGQDRAVDAGGVEVTDLERR